VQRKRSARWRLCKANPRNSPHAYGTCCWSALGNDVVNVIGLEKANASSPGLGQAFTTIMEESYLIT
jgi:hypothetical protein